MRVQPCEAAQPPLHLFALVRGAVVENDVDRVVRRHAAFHLFEKRQKLLMPMARHAVLAHGAGRDIERHEQRGGAMSLVLVRPSGLLSPMSEEFEVLALAVSRLEQVGIEYLITGSFALAAYATPRMTRDIDVLIDCTPAQAVALARSFQGDSYASPEAAREAVAAMSMFNVIHNATLLKLDFIVRKPHAFADQQFARRRSIALGDFSAWFISPEDLVLAKLLWRRDTGSEQQLKDVRSLLAAGLGLDEEYLAMWSNRLDLVVDLQHARDR